MFLRILIKEMKVRKSVNFILFLFITIASVFLSSSVSNIVVVTSAIDYYMEYANTPDVMLLTTRTEEKEEIQRWLEEDAVSVENSDYEELVCIAESGISLLDDETDRVFTAEGVEIIAGTQENEYCKVYNLDGESFELLEGEIALGRNLMEQNGLELGDRVAIRVGEVEKTFTIRENTKDAVFGSPMSGMQRVLMHKEDFDSYVSQENVPLYGLHYVEAEDAKACVREIGDKEFDTISNMQTGENYKMIYSMDMIMAAVLIFMGLCFIFIAFLVLRFALVFTIEEDYREIGIMKAIGMREFAIKKIYLTKYLFLVVSGAVVGLFASVPVSAVMTDSVSQNMIMESSYANLWINVLCTILIIAVVMLFCYRCTKKLNKISAVEAIRGGQGSERFGKRKGIKLYKRNRMSMPLYLGINDIMSNIKRYLILLFTFCISFILITIPLNTLNTMRSREMVEKFDLNPESSIYVRELETGGETYKNIVDLENGLDKLQKALKEEGYDADLTYSPMYFLRYGDDSGIINGTIKMYKKYKIKMYN